MKTYLRVFLVIMVIGFFIGCAATPKISKKEVPIKTIDLVETLNPKPLTASNVPPAIMETKSEPYYRIVGESKRRKLVVDYLQERGYKNFIQEEKKITHPYRGDDAWPMVDISEGGDSQAGIVSIPLSDKAVQKGLCSDQENLLEKNFPVITALPLRTPPMDSTCNGVSYSFSPDGKEITMTVIFQPKTIYGLEGKKVCLHSRYLNHQDPDADVLTSSIIQNGQATFTFENPVLYGKEERYKVKLSSGEKEGYVERFWFSSDNRWPVPLYCDKNLYPDTNGNLAIEGMFTEKEVFPVSEMNNYPYDRPTKFGENVDYVYDLTKLRECCSQ